MIKEAAASIKKVWNYEKTINADIRALQNMLVIFAIVMLLIDMENFKLGKYVIGGTTLFAAVVCILCTAVLNRYQKEVYRIGRLVVIVLLALALPLAVGGANDGFSLLWYMLIPIFTLVLFGMPFGVPACIGFGLGIMLLFWTPVRGVLLYSYPREYLYYYPIFYWGFCLLTVVMDIFYKLYQILQVENEKKLEEEVQHAVDDTKKLMVNSVATISRMLDEKDSYTQEHSQRVAEYSALIAQNLKTVSYTEREISLIYRSALLHDIGKIAIPDAVLNKPARLTDEEFEIMKKHTIWGREILSELKFLPQADLGASYHHEHYDGTGYPFGMKGEELPLITRIISAADALDAMNSNRCYRKHCDKDYIIGEFEKGAGTQFDPQVAQTVVQLIREEKIVVL